MAKTKGVILFDITKELHGDYNFSLKELILIKEFIISMKKTKKS